MTSDPSTEPRLTRFQLDAWRDLKAPEWQPFRSAWLAKGLLYPPAGDQRALLWQIADGWPESLGKWVAEAPSRVPRQIIDHVLLRFHAMRDQAADDELAMEMARRERLALDKEEARQGLQRITELLKPPADR
jgi:hypothetical protein